MKLFDNLQMNYKTYDEITNLYNCLICSQYIVGQNTSILPGRDRIRSIMIKKGYLKPGQTCPWKRAMKLLNATNSIEVKSCSYTKLRNITIGDFIRKIQIGIYKYDLFLSNNITETDTISNSNEVPIYIKKRRKQLYPKKSYVS